MPIMDGFEATKEIRKFQIPHGINPSNIYIVALTAYATDNFKEKALSSGMDDFFTKPVCSQQIQQHLIKINISK